MPLPTQDARAGGGRSQPTGARKQLNRVPPALANRPRMSAPSGTSVALVTAPYASEFRLALTKTRLNANPIRHGEVALCF